MEILKYKYLRPNRYKIYLSIGDYTLYEDIIVKYQILLKKDITKEDLELFLKDNSYYEYYYKVLNYIKFRIRSKKEIYKYLEKDKVPVEISNKIITNLEKDGYVNDKLFAKYYIADQINLKNDGPNKIKNELTKLGIEGNIIDEELKAFTKVIQIDKIKKYIVKEEKCNKNKSLYVLKNKILTNLITKGFYREDISKQLDGLEVDDNEIYNKEYQKLYQKLSKKYSGYELEIKIKQKLYQQGLYK